MIIRLENRSYTLKFYCQAEFSIPYFGVVGNVSPTLSTGESYNFNFQDTTTITSLLLRIVYQNTTLRFDNTPVLKNSTTYSLYGGTANPYLLINPYK